VPIELLLALVQDVSSAATPVAAQGSSGFRSMWNVIEQAGPLRWPIFAVLGIGLALVIGKMYDLLRDRSHAAKLLSTDYRPLSLRDITALVARQRESMVALLQSTMLNVYHTRPSESMLHDEISNFVTSQQDRFGVFRRRMEFLSDTAGALGLMGTVWGMFVVFFQGTSDRDVILRGMGIALITTLLGLVVSIILNLSATELSTAFDKRLDRIGKKSDELRFRLLELTAAPSNGRRPRTGPRSAPRPHRRQRPTRRPDRSRRVPNGSTSRASRQGTWRRPAKRSAASRCACVPMGGDRCQGWPCASRCRRTPERSRTADASCGRRRMWGASFASAGRRRPAPARIT
jgi:biopolymer transport protein ExbB/TolQ